MLTLPTGISESYRNLIVKEGLVAVSATTCFGWGKTTVNGGGIRFTANMTTTDVSRPIIYEGSGIVDVPEGVKWLFRTNTFSCANAVVTKTGAGTWQSYDPVRWTKSAINNARWVIQEGKLRCCPGDMFEGYTGTHNLVIEVQEDGMMEIYGGDDHTPVCSIVLRGGTLRAPYGQFTSAGQPIEGGSRWKGWGLNGPITALPSRNGKPSRIIARACHLKHGADPAATTFDVQGGATLEIDAILQPGVGGTLGNLVKDRFSSSSESILVTNSRHHEALRHSAESLSAAQSALEAGLPSDLVAQDLRAALYHLGTITGAVSSDEVLGLVFSRFCIGK